VPGLPVQVARAVLYVHRHVFEPGLNAATVRAGCGVRNHNLTTLFRDTLGVTLRRYIETLRLEAAERLLRTVPSEVFLIAAAVGYDHHETFCRAFRRRFGCTPLASRARAAQHSFGPTK
jgi:AraC-like DNA-binding protein